MVHMHALMQGASNGANKGCHAKKRAEDRGT